MATLGQRLKAYRLLAGLSQNQLAQRANVHRPIISEVESGKQANLTLETARRLTQVLGISLEMLAGDGEPESASTPPKKRPRSRKAAPVG
jgi:transcriptional regulator with XRE-family HTH domain